MGVYFVFLGEGWVVLVCLVGGFFCFVLRWGFFVWFGFGGWVLLCCLLLLGWVFGGSVCVCEMPQRLSSSLKARISVGDIETESLLLSWQGCSDTPRSAF